MSNPQRDDQTRSLRAFVLCGGLGTRLRTVLSDRPKSMAPVAGVPFLDLLLQTLRAEGIQEVILGTGYMSERIERHFRNGRGLDLSIRYSHENEPLGTGGALKLAEKLLSDPVVVLNGDSYVEWSLGSLRRLFDEKNAGLVMVLQTVPDVSRYGSVTIDSDGRVIEFVEKGTRKGPGLINAGVYLLEKKIVSGLPAGRTVSLEKDVFPKLPGGKLYGLVSDGLFIDIGIPADLNRAQTLLVQQARAANGGKAGAKPAC